MRLFLAFPVDEILSFRLLSMAKNLPQAKWRQEEQLHLTVQYLGNLDEQKAIELDLKLAELEFDALSFEVFGVGVLERFGRVSIHAAIKPNEYLSIMRSKILRVIRRTGIELERARFTPHITLAYLPAEIDQSRVQNWLDKNREFSAEFTPTHLALFESIQSKHSMVYEIRATYPFGVI